MYLKLGNAVLNYSNEVIKDSFMIFAEIVDSTISYERPILVRTAEELDIWFGKYFSSYFYLKQLLQSRENTVLYLYKPIKILTTEVTDKNLDGGTYELKSDLPPFGKRGTFYYVSSLDEYYIYYQGSWISKQEYDSLINYEISGNNRDTLMLTTKDNIFFSYYHPSFESSTSSIAYHKISLLETNNDARTYLRNLNIERIYNKTQTFSFKVSVNKTILDKGYILIPSIKTNEVGKFRVCKTGNLDLTTELNKLRNSGIEIIGNENQISTSSELLKVYIDCGYYIINDEQDFSFTAYSVVPLPNIIISTYSNIEVQPDIAFNSSILANLSKDTNSIFCYSKTIGKTADKYDDDKITVLIEKIDYNNNIYRFTIKKYTYEEMFEGPIKSEDGAERLDYIISKNSKLIYCDFYDVSLGIREGLFELSGAFTNENTTAEEYIDTMDRFISFANEKEIFPDYIMIPDLTKYIYHPSQYETIYNLLNVYAKTLETQFLIQNTPSNDAFVDLTKNNGAYSGLPMTSMMTGIDTIYRIYALNGETTESVNHYIFETPLTSTLINDIYRIKLAEYGNSYIFNPDDKDNRLLFFYQTCLVDNIFKVPLYYIYIQGLLKDIYSYSSKAFTLDNRVEFNNDPYEESELEKNLKKYKSNYMVCNNQVYYFKQMQDGISYNTTGWMRFVLGKIYRELQKDKRELFGEHYKDKIEASIRKTLNRVASNFSIIKSLNIESLIFNDNENSVSLSINVGVKQIVGEDMIIDFILNYNT